jgi:hypothetical protein
MQKFKQLQTEKAAMCCKLQIKVKVILRVKRKKEFRGSLETGNEVQSSICHISMAIWTMK